MSFNDISVGDRVLVSGCTENDGDTHWGEVIGQEGEGIFVKMDDPTLLMAELYGGNGIPNSYLAFEHEVKDYYTMPKPIPEPTVDTYVTVAKALAESYGEDYNDLRNNDRDSYYRDAQTAVTAYLKTLN